MTPTQAAAVLAVRQLPATVAEIRKQFDPSGLAETPAIRAARAVLDAITPAATETKKRRVTNALRRARRKTRNLMAAATGFQYFTQNGDQIVVDKTGDAPIWCVHRPASEGSAWGFTDLDRALAYARQLATFTPPESK